MLSLSEDNPRLLTEEESLVQRLAVSVARRGGRDTTAEFEVVTKTIGPEKAIAVLWLIGRYMAHAVIVNTLNLAPPPVAVRQENAQ